MSEPQPIFAPTPAPAPTPEKKKKDTLAIVALVFAALFFVPLAPLVGLILGIVALSTGRARTLSIVAVCLGAFFTLFVGVEVAIAIPAFMKYVRRAKAREAYANINNLAGGVAALPAQQWASLADSDWTPAGSACELPGRAFRPDEKLWSGQPWAAIGFRVDGPFRYQYRVRREAQGFLVEARGDLDCDGVYAHFQRHVTPEGPGPVQSDNENE